MVPHGVSIRAFLNPKNLRLGDLTVNSRTLTCIMQLSSSFPRRASPQLNSPYCRLQQSECQTVTVSIGVGGFHKAQIVNGVGIPVTVDHPPRVITEQTVDNADVQRVLVVTNKEIEIVTVVQETIMVPIETTPDPTDTPPIPEA